MSRDIDAGPAVTAPSRRLARFTRIFASFAYREFRLLWLGQFGQSSASFGERVTRSWLALDLTGSAFQLGALELTRGVASLVVGMWGGVLADRFDKRVLLMVVQIWTFGFYVLMACLAFSGNLQLWHLYASALGLALSGAVSHPIRSSMIPALVPESLVINAMSLSSIATNATRMGAPITVAAFIQVTGSGAWGYAVCGSLYLLVLFVTTRMQVIDVGESAGGSMLASLVQGWSFIVRNRPVLTQLLVGFGPLTIGFTYQAMLAVYTIDTLGQGAAAYGALYSCAGLGALLGGLAVASLGAVFRRGRLLLLAGAANGLAMVGMGALGLLPSAWPLFALAVPLLMLAGGSQTSFRAANNGLLLASTPREMRGRVMSLDEVFRSSGTLLAPVVGALADASGSDVAMATIGVGCLVVLGVVLAWQPRIKDL